jgi:hypothetical protein
MTNRDSKGKFTKAAPFKAGDRVIALPHCGYGEMVVGSTGTVLSHPNPSLALILVAFLPDYPDGLYFCPNEIALAPSTDTETISPDELHCTEAELREAMAEVARLKAEAKDRVQVYARKVQEAKEDTAAVYRLATAVESKLSDIAYVVRTWEIMRDGKTELPFMGAIKKVLGRKGA